MNSKICEFELRNTTTNDANSLVIKSIIELVQTLEDVIHKDLDALKTNKLNDSRYIQAINDADEIVRDVFSATDRFAKKGENNGRRKDSRRKDRGCCKGRD